MLKKYDFLCSVGNSCLASHLLRKHNLQHESYPLDWMWFENFDDVLKMLEADYANLINPQYLKQVQENKVYNSYHNSLYNVTLHHDFRKDYSEEENLRIVANRYQRRVERMAQRINDAKTILAVHCVENETEDKQKITKQFSGLQNLWKNKHIDMLYLNLDENISNDSQEFISDHILKINIAVKHGRKYEDNLKAAHQYLKGYRTSWKVKILQIMRSCMVAVRKMFLKLLVIMPMPKVYKNKIKLIYKDRFRA